MTGFLFLHLTQGITLELVFSSPMWLKGLLFPLPPADRNMREACAEHQMRTTANFAPSSILACFFLGQLNRQIEHHLFPKICHVHYGRISIIVKQTALEFGIPYHQNRTFLSTLRSHYRILKKLGNSRRYR